MNLRRCIAAATSVLALASTIGAAVTVPATAGLPSRTAEVRWQPCPDYSDDVLRARGIPDDQLAEFRRLMARTECGSVSVPLDYTQPDGRWITVAVTRLRATDSAHRLGSLAVNPGGPGGSGYLMPIDLLMQSAAEEKLNERYDLIGFDPRGVGYSTKVDCPAPDSDGGKRPPGPLTEEHARELYDAGVRDNQVCGNYDSAFLGQLTTANVARDLDLIRAALHEPKISFLGVSWGTALGVAYRSLFPGRVGRMWLDSVAIPHFQGDVFVDRRAAATAQDFARMVAWIAKQNDTYGFGSTAAQVETALLGLRREYEAEPRQFTDLPRVIDGNLIAQLCAQDSTAWPLATKALAELRDATGPTAPPTVKEIFSGEPGDSPPGAPEEFNSTMQQAVFCNEDPARLDFAAAWAAYQQRLARYPVTGEASKFTAGCAGWPLPVQPVQLRRTGGSLVLAGHRYEAVSPYEWTGDMLAAVGGKTLTVDDDVHGSVLMVKGCAAVLVAYLNTGRLGTSKCEGVPVPSKSAPSAGRLPNVGPVS